MIDDNEEWRPIEKFNGFYEVSSLGNVRSTNHIIIDRLGRKLPFKGKLLSKNLGKRKTYYYVRIHCPGFNSRVAIHRLVAETFIPNPDGLPCVNHKDENKLNNRADNLERCTYEYNVNYGNGISKRSISSRNQEHRSSAILQYDLEGNLIAEYPSFKEAQRQIGHDYSSIRACCNGKYNTAYGFKWRYKDDKKHLSFNTIKDG